MKPSLRYDPRTLDQDGLPHLGEGESFFHASFEVEGEEQCVEGVVCAETGSQAASLLLAAEAHHRFTSYGSLLRLAKHALTRRLDRSQALELAPKVPHRVSMWKSAPEPVGATA